MGGLWMFMVLFYLQLAGPPCKIQDQIIRFGGRTEGPKLGPWKSGTGDTTRFLASKIAMKAYW